MNLGILRVIQGWAKIKGNSDGTFIGNVGDRIKVSSSQQSEDLLDFYLEITKGNIPNHNALISFGYNSALEAGTHTVWDGGGVYPFQSSASIPSIASNNANDSSAGTGARTVKVYGLDASYIEQNEIVTLNGTNSVNLTNSYLRIFKIHVITAGSTGENEGTITLTQSGTTVAIIKPGRNNTMMAVYTIPANKTGYVSNWHIIISKSAGSTQSKSAEGRLRIRDLNEVFKSIHPVNITSESGGFFSKNKSYRILPEKTDIYLEASVDSNNSAVSGQFELVVVS